VEKAWQVNREIASPKLKNRSARFVILHTHGFTTLVIWVIIPDDRRRVCTSTT
jgi:hypothetical protein